jgi:hypothetical protein
LKLGHCLPASLLRNSRQFAKFADKNFFQKSGLKRDGPVFFLPNPVKLARNKKIKNLAPNSQLLNYQTTLERQMYRALDQLEKLQLRRQAENTPADVGH